MELKTQDIWVLLRGVKAPSSPIVIVVIDEKSQDVLGHWPFSRSRFADALDIMRTAGAKVVAFDVVFPQPDENSALQTVRQIRRDFDAGVGRGGEHSDFAKKLKAFEAEVDNDQKLADALSHYDNAILGYYLLFSPDEIKSQNKQRVDEFVNYLSFQAYPQVIHAE